MRTVVPHRLCTERWNAPIQLVESYVLFLFPHVALAARHDDELVAQLHEKVNVLPEKRRRKHENPRTGRAGVVARVAGKRKRMRTEKSR